MNNRIALGFAAVAAVVGLGSVAIFSANAADHTDPAGVATTADIADLYAWAGDSDTTAGNDKLYAIITLDGNKMPAANQAGTYSADVLFTLYIDEDGDLSNGSDNRIDFRFGQDGDGAWGVQAEGVPGETAAISGAVETVLSGTATTPARVYAGLADDPFFFDFEGFELTVNSIMTDPTGVDDNMFMPTRDSFAGNNATVIAVEIDLSNFTGTDLQVWAASSTIGS